MAEIYLNEDARKAKKILQDKGVNISQIVQRALIKEAGISENVNPYKEQLKAIREKSKAWDKTNKETIQIQQHKFKQEMAREFGTACRNFDYEKVAELLKPIKKRLTKKLMIKIEHEWKGNEAYYWWCEQYDQIN